ncbi:MAG: AmmeMemoRadiSam system protein A [Actinobacteria bacterium]|nr:AmmeMemoRadiSam system protein A [Actinomycetota bacterium]
MPVVIGCLMPHPPIIVPEVGRGSIDRVESTVHAMESISEEVMRANPETLVFISPHSAGFADSFAVKADPTLVGSFANFGAANIAFSVQNDLQLVEALLMAANSYELSMTKVGSGYVKLFQSGELDHGALVPLYYLRRHVDLPIILLSISYGGFDEHYSLGVAIQKASDSIPKRVAFIASGDLSHRLIPGAPAGYNPRAIDFDAKIDEIFDTGYFNELVELDPSLIDAAGECGLRSIYALAGAFNGFDVRTKIYSYEAPFGVGYMAAAVYPGEPSPERDLYTIEVEDLPPVAPSPSEPVKLAMYSLDQYFKQGHPITPPVDTAAELLEKRAGVFVCLKVDGNLRGCIGTVQPTQANVAEEIITNAIQAAEADPRFPPISIDELPLLQFIVDILEEPEKVESKGQLDHKTYGVIVRRGYKAGLLLPDVEGINSVEEQLAVAKRKAGILPHEEAEIFRFRVTRYE